MKRLVLIVVPLILLLGGGGLAAYLIFLAPNGEQAAEAPPPPEPELVSIDALTIPVIRHGAVQKYVLVKITLQMTDRQSKALAFEVMPRLKDAIYRELHAYLASLPLDAPLSTRVMKQRVGKVSEDTLGRNAVHQVLIEGIYEKRGS